MNAEALDQEDFLNCTDYFLDENIRQGRADNTALHYQGKAISYQALIQLTNQLGHGLKKLGVEVEDKVLIVLKDSPELIAAFYAVQKVGAGAIVGYVDSPVDEYQYLLELLRPRLIITDGHCIASLRKAAADAGYNKAIVVHQSNVLEPGSEHSPIERQPQKFESREHDFYPLIKDESQELSCAKTHREDYARWSFTGGSTGFPKVVPASHAGLIDNFHSFQEIVQLSADDVVLSVPKLYFGYGRTAAAIYPFRVGASAVIFPERSTPEKICELIAQHQPTVLVLVPTLIKKVLAMPEDKRPNLERVRLCISGGETLSANLYDEWQSAFGCEVLNMLGSTEMGFIYIANRPGEVVPGSVGKPLKGYEAKIVDSQYQELADGEIGILMAKGPSAAQLYWHEKRKSQQTFQGEWIYTGDRFKKDAEGNFWFEGRGDDLVKVSGNWLSPMEVEGCILAHPLVQDCAVTTLADQYGMQQVKAYIVLVDKDAANEATTKTLQDYVKSTLAPYKYPRMIEYLEDLPTTATGKVDRKQLVS